MADSRRPRNPSSGGRDVEKELFLRVMADVRPLHAQPGVKPSAKPSKAARPWKIAAPMAPEMHRNPPPLQIKGRAATSAMDGRNAERLIRGRMEIEARLDLHGLRQDEAERALKDFIRRNHAHGKRCVLVITGTGRRAQESRMDQAENRRFVMPERRGVLFNLVPAWLGAPELAPYVVAFTPAQPKHGGSGALYVYLRRTTSNRIRSAPSGFPLASQAKNRTPQ
jgi:DNA-nicking Smr family endonuclease